MKSDNYYSPAYKALLEAKAIAKQYPVNPPHGTFRGRNMMTPEWVAYVYCAPLDCWAEISWGTGMSHEAIWGVTFRRANDTRLSPDPSKLVYSFKEALALARSGGVEEEE